MRNKTQEIIECSRWLFPAVLFSGWFAPLVYLINVLLEILNV